MAGFISRLLLFSALLGLFAAPVAEAQSIQPSRSNRSVVRYNSLANYKIASSALTTTYRSSGSINAGYNNTLTITSITFYSGKNIVAVMSSQTNQASATLDGTSGTKVASLTTGYQDITFWEFSKASGGTGSLVVNSGGISSFYSAGYILWSTNASASFQASVTLAYGYHPDNNLPDNNTNDTPSITFPTGGAIMWAGLSETVGISVTGVRGTTLDATFTEGSNFRFFGGQRSSTGNIGINGASYSGSMLIGVSYQ